MFCPNCGYEYSNDQPFCPNCGAPRAQTENPPAPPVIYGPPPDFKQEPPVMMLLYGPPPSFKRKTKSWLRRLFRRRK